MPFGLTWPQYLGGYLIAGAGLVLGIFTVDTYFDKDHPLSNFNELVEAEVKRVRETEQKKSFKERFVALHEVEQVYLQKEAKSKDEHKKNIS